MDYLNLISTTVDVSPNREVVITHEGYGYVKFKIRNKKSGIASPDFLENSSLLEKAILAYAKECPKYRPSCTMFIAHNTALFHFVAVEWCLSALQFVVHFLKIKKRDRK